jgi:UPF0755 protein
MRKWKIIGIILLLAAAIVGYKIYNGIFKPVVMDPDGTHFYIATGSDFGNVLKGLKDSHFITNKISFQKLAEIKKYTNNIKPGRYRIEKGMSNNDLVNLLRSGVQEEVVVTFNYARTKEKAAGLMCRKLEADSGEFVKMLNDPQLCAENGFTLDNIGTLLIPNSYNFYWNTSASHLYKRLLKEFRVFWTEARLTKAKNIGLSPQEVSVLASIVVSETSKKEDAPIIAGVYLNRLKKGIPFQADPTLIFAKGDLTIRRVLNKDKEVDSPYNTYKNAGLPPGPIYISPARYLDYVLDYKKHDYIFFCAKEDFSGYSNFAKTNTEHNRNARKYRNALNKRGIRR